MFSRAGLEKKKDITFHDFQSILEEHKDALNYASLNLEGTGVGVETTTAVGRNKRENAPSRARRTLHNAYR